MFNPKKSDLNIEMIHYKLMVRMRAGIHYLLEDNRKQIIMTVFVVVSLLIWCFRGLIWNTPKCPPIGEIGGTLASLVVMIVGTVGILVAFGRPFEAEEIDKKLIRAGFVNAIGESPVLLYKEVLSREEKKYLFVFASHGLPMSLWNQKIDLVENALNIYISEIRLKDSKQTIEVYAVDGEFVFPTKICWTDDLLSDEESEMLIGVKKH